MMTSCDPPRSFSASVFVIRSVEDSECEVFNVHASRIIARDYCAARIASDLRWSLAIRRLLGASRKGKVRNPRRKKGKDGRSA